MHPEAKSCLHSLQTLGALEHLPRTGWILRGIAAPETIGAHILSTAFIVLALGPRVQPELDTERALCLVLVHDVPEAMTGDLPRTAAELFPAGAKAHAETRAAERLLAPLSSFAMERWREFTSGATREARFARVCDRLQLGLRYLSYVQAGARNLDEFRATLEELDCGEFAPAEELRREILAAANAV
jgi:putative hydrolases of HD superfamily